MPSSRDLLGLFAGFLVLATWDVVGLDLPISLQFGDAAGFAWRDRWLTSELLHDDARTLAWLLFALLVACLWWPLPIARGLSRSERVAWVATMLGCVAVIALLKHVSRTSCPWSLVEFGGTAQRVSHWAFGVRDGGPGHCFPAGHANVAFCFLPGYFFLRRTAAGAARAWLLATLLAGLVLGATQVMRGAHFVSHVLWTGWWCWAICLGGLAAHDAWRRRRPAAASEPGIAR